MRIVLLVFLLTACKGGDENDDAISIMIVTGYENAVHGDTIYVPCEANIGPQQAEFCIEAGTAFLMWAGAREKERDLIPNGTKIKQYHFQYVPHFSTPEVTQAVCERRTGSAGAIACTEPTHPLKGNPCTMWIAKDYPELDAITPMQTEAVWIHEWSHCVNGRFHG